MERESLEMDVVFVGAGPANLSGAYHLARLVKRHNEAVASRKDGRPDADGRPGHDVSRDHANCLRLRGTESSALAGSIEALPMQLHLGCV